ncbi:MAG: sulfite exporter TauE/SafE family protein [Bacteroidota bacterium]
MEWYQIIAVLVVGLAAGFINTIAGGGSSITLPMLMFMGLPANVANGTNRIAILLQSMVGAGTFRSYKVLPLREGWRLSVPSAMGALAGALMAVEVSDEVMRWFIIVLMVAMLLLVIFKPEAWIKQQAGVVSAKTGWLQYLVFFLIGFYGGFIQVGVGFLLLAGLVLGSGLDLVKANALKVMIVLVYTIIALTIFWSNNQVHLGMGLLLGTGSMAGAYLGARFTIRGGAVLVRYFLIAMLTVMILKLLNIF